MSATSDLIAEITFLRVVCSDTLDLYKKSKLLSQVDKTHFGFSLTKEIYIRILSVLRSHSATPSMLELMTDPVLSDDARQFIKDRAPRKIKITKTLLRSLRTTLQTYRQIRAMASVAKMLAESLGQPGVNNDRLLEKATNKLNEAKLVTVDSEKLYHFGLTDNAKNLVNSVLNGAADVLYPTGFTGFDGPSGGLPNEGLFIIAATTSGGKSAICNIVLKNMYLQSNLDVVKVTLEMSERQETRRLISCLTQIPHDKFRRNDLSIAEKRFADKTYQDFKQHGIDNNCRFTIWSPQTCTSLDKILLMVQPYKYNVVAIDYISLLNEDSNDAQWQVLMDLSVRCKAFSRKNKCLVILLAQLDEDSEKIRYARAIKENADVAWAWAYHKKEHRESRILTINILKGRDMEIFSFQLLERFDVMSAEDLDAEQSDQHYSDNSVSKKDEEYANKKHTTNLTHSDLEDTTDDSTDATEHAAPNARKPTGKLPSNNRKTGRTPKGDEAQSNTVSKKKYTKKPRETGTVDYDDGYKSSSKKQASSDPDYDELDLSSVSSIDYTKDGMY